jgi:hypothetical protein
LQIKQVLLSRHQPKVLVQKQELLYSQMAVEVLEQLSLLLLQIMVLQ